MKIILVGGGTGGPVMPLIAVKQKVEKKHPDAEFLFVGTNNGLEEKFAAQYNIPFVGVRAGKLRRYFSVRTLLVPFEILLGFIEALGVIRNFKPDVIFGAGGYVTVPVAIAAWISGVKTVVHQQDVYPSLTNQIVAPLATRITVSFEGSLKDFRINSGLFGSSKEPKVIWTGNPFREDLLQVTKDPKEIKKSFGINDELPVVLFLGGATGALKLNEILQSALPELTAFAQIIHSTGKGKGIGFKSENYHSYELISNMPEAYAIADIVVSRAGLSTITELSALKKVSIVVPMPDSHQEYNAEILHNAEAALCFDQNQLTPELLISTIRKIMYDAQWQNQLKENIHKIMPDDAADKIAEIIINLCR